MSSPRQTPPPPGPIAIPPHLFPTFQSATATQPPISTSSTTPPSSISPSIPRQLKYRPTAYMYPFDHMTKFQDSTLPQHMETHFLQRITHSDQNKFLWLVGGVLLFGLLWTDVIAPKFFGYEDKPIPETIRKMSERNAIRPDQLRNSSALPWEKAQGNTGQNTFEKLSNSSNNSH